VTFFKIYDKNVVAVEDFNLATTVALKEYYPIEFGDRDSTMSVRPKSERHKKTFEWGRSSFLQEARMLARFRHPSIVRVSRVFEAHSTAYMVMDFEQGQNFEQWLTALDRPPTQEELDRIVAPLLDALELMHAQDFLHRDIAPDNIIVRPDGTPVLLDFGAARRAVAEMSRTLTGIVKAGYSPQEQYATEEREAPVGVPLGGLHPDDRHGKDQEIEKGKSKRVGTHQPPGCLE
jgi:serine/threonine protein kinase